MICPTPNLDELTEYGKTIGLGHMSSTYALRAFMTFNNNLQLGQDPIVPSKEQFRGMLEDLNVWNTEGRQPVMTDRLHGFADVMNAFPEYKVLMNSIKLDTESQSLLKASATVNLLAEKLSGNLNVPYEFITEDEAVRLTKNLDVWKGQPGFFYNGKVYLIPNLVTEKTVLHEFAHPLIRAIRMSNPALFNNLVQKLRSTSRGQDLISQSRDSYSDLAEDDPTILEEALVRSLSNTAEEDPQSAFSKFISDLLFAIKQIIRKVFGDTKQKIKVENLKADTTLEELADMLVLEQFDIDLSAVTNDDVILYMEDVNKYVEAMKNLSTNELQKSTNLFFEMVKKQIRLLEKNKDYEGMKEILKDAFQRPDLMEIFKNLAPYQDIKAVYENEMSQLYRDAEFARKHTEAFVNSLIRTKYMVRRLNAALLQLVKDPNSKQNVATVFYYNNVISYWESFLADLQKKLDDDAALGNIDNTNPIYELIGSIATEIKTSRNHTSKIYFAGTSSIIKETLAPMQSQIDEKFKNMMEDLKKRNASPEIIALRQKDYWGLSGDALSKFLSLKNKVDGGESLTASEKEVYDRLKLISYKEGAYLSEEKIEYLMTGELGDAHALNSFLEGYIYNQDPVVFGFATFVKNRMTEVFTNSQVRGNKFLSEVKPLLEAAGYNQANPAEFGRRVTFLDSKGGKNPETGEHQEELVHTLINPWKGYRYAIDKMRNEIRAEELVAATSGDTTKLLELKLKLQEEERTYFHNKYTRQYYDRYNVFRKGPNDVIGAKAEAVRADLLAKIQNLTSGMGVQSINERLDASEELEGLWREYRQLFSNYLPSGSLKDEEGIKIAERLREFRTASKDLYREELIPDLFTNALAAHEQYLVDLGYERGTPAFNRLRTKWLYNNTRVKVKDSYFEKQKEILDELKDLTSSLPKDADTQEELADLYERLLQLMSPYRDDDMQPEATAMDVKNIAEIKRVQQLIEITKKGIAKASGLTPLEHDELTLYFQKLKNGEDLLTSERLRLNDLLLKKEKEGLPEKTKKRIYELYADLAELQESVPTDYYIDIVNNYMYLVDLEALQERMGFKDVDKTNAKFLLDERFLDFLDEQSPEFAEWFRNNHTMQKAVDRDGEEYIKIERVKAWSVTRPKSAEYLELFSFTNSQGEPEVISGVPTMNYYDRVVKDEYVTKVVTLQEAIEMGDVKLANVDAKGDFLPRLDVPDSPYINEKYFQLEKDKNLHRALVALMKWQMDFQKDSPNTSKLFLDVPRYMRSNYEARLSMFSAEGKMENPISSWWKRFRALFVGSADDFDRGYGLADQQTMAKGDLFDDQFAGVPITGLSNIEYDNVSLNITESMLRYMISAEKQRVLIEMNPMARALQTVLSDPDNTVRQIKGLSKNMLDSANLINAFEQKATKLTKKGEKSIRQKAVDNFIEREFEGKLQKGALGADSDNIWIHKLADNIMKASAFGYFAMDIPSAIKNSFGLRIQSLIEAAGGKYFNHQSYTQGTAWSNKATWEISLELYKFGPKSLNTQIIELFDPYQGRFEEKFIEHGSRSLTKDALGGLSWMTSFRKWTELNSTLSIFGAMMYHEKSVERTVNGVKQRISYMDAWEIKDGQLQLKEGVDKDWDINGIKFKAFKNKVHGVTNNLAGSFAKFEYAEADRYVAFRFAIAFKRWFLRMFLNRWQHRGSLRDPRYRFDAAVGDTAMGYHIEAIRSFGRMIKTRGEYANFLSDDEKASMLKTIMDVAYVVAFSMAISLIFGFDEDDEDKFAKLRSKSGPLPIFGVAEDQGEFKLGGWMSNHLLYLTMQLKNESVQWLPIPGYGADNYIDLLSMESVSMTNTWDNYKKIIAFSALHAGHSLFGTDHSKAYFDQDEGPYVWMQKEGDTWYEGSKVLTYFGRSLGLSGKTLSPDMAIINWVKGQNWR